VLDGDAILGGAVDVLEYGTRQALLCNLPKILDIAEIEIAAFHGGLRFDRSVSRHRQPLLGGRDDDFY
jgi:hypothetical protein